MTPPENLDARPSAIHPSPRRATARNAEVCSNSDNDRHDVLLRIPSQPASSHPTGVRAPRIVDPRLCCSLRAIWRSLKSHS